MKTKEYALVEPQTPTLRIRNYVVIPVKDQKEMTENLLNQLDRQGGYDGIIVLDNGSGDETKKYLEEQSIARVIDAEGAGIHRMWNMGMEIALERGSACNITFLNNDLILGDNFLKNLATALRAGHRLMAISPNYDGRVIPCTTIYDRICANQYDGKGGVPGFAFMVKGEWFADGYRFPEECMWWFGDNDILNSMLKNGYFWGITPNVTVDHIGGGGQTGDWDAYMASPVFKTDAAAFYAKWPRGIFVAPVA